MTEHSSPAEGLLAVISHRNEAWGHYSDIVFFMSDGNIYRSLESVDIRAGSMDEGLSEDERLALLIRYTDPVARISDEDISELLRLLPLIDNDAEFARGDECWFDAGTSQMIARIGGEPVVINEWGESFGRLKDENASNVTGILEKYSRTLKAAGAPHVYSQLESFIGIFDCSGKDLARNSRGFITTPEELEAFVKDAGIDLGSADGFEFFDTAEIFKDHCLAVELFDHPVSGFRSPDAFIVSGSYVGFVCLDEDEAPSDPAERGSIHCRMILLPNNDMKEYELFTGK